MVTVEDNIQLSALCRVHICTRCGRGRVELESEVCGIEEYVLEYSVIWCRVDCSML